MWNILQYEIWKWNEKEMITCTMYMYENKGRAKMYYTIKAKNIAVKRDNSYLQYFDFVTSDYILHYGDSEWYCSHDVSESIESTIWTKKKKSDSNFFTFENRKNLISLQLVNGSIAICLFKSPKVSEREQMGNSGWRTLNGRLSPLNVLHINNQIWIKKR